MNGLSHKERRQAEAIAGIGYCNPFLPERIELERIALGDEHAAGRVVLSQQPGVSLEEIFPNQRRLRSLAKQLTDQFRNAIVSQDSVNERELLLYQDLALYHLYSEYLNPIDQLTHRRDFAGPQPFPLWEQFRQDFAYYLRLPDVSLPDSFEPQHALACFFQIERAFHLIFDFLIGTSVPMTRLRAAVWQSIFTHDMRRYTRGLYQQMHTVSTLITGPSGTGKELVARAIGLARYIDFDPKSKSFSASNEWNFRAVNLAALAPTLIESELFGHVKGAFSGAVKDRSGRLESNDHRTTVFLDEVGELTTEIQVKLLRVLQTREFHRVGDFGNPRQFRGRLVAATNRDLVAEMQAGRFREDFYFRMCADTIHTPSLREQLAGQPSDLARIVRHIVDEVVGDLSAEIDQLTTEVVEWVESHLGADYPWPGNIRELEQCVRSVMIRKHYQPPINRRPTQSTVYERFLEALMTGQLTDEELQRHYHSLVYARTGTYQAAGRRLGVDWKTVRKKVDPQLVALFQEMDDSL